MELLNFTFASEGYRQEEMDKFISDVNRVSDYLFTQSPFKEYKNYFNVYAIKVPSKESGANHFQKSPDPACVTVPIDTVDNAFNTWFDNFFIHRLIMPQRIDLLYDAAVKSFPNFYKMVVIVNSPYYGGSGGNYPTITSLPRVEDVLAHELGHSFADLADEYWVDVHSAGEFPNMTQQSNASLVKWKNWVGSNGIGVYPFNESPSWFRPHQDCKMRHLDSPFCSVCKEEIVEIIHSLFWIKGPLTEILPAPGFVIPVGTDIEFKLVTINPDPNTIKITWRLNDKIISKNTASVILSDSQLNDGKFKTIRAEVIDTTSFVRRANHATGHLFLYEWFVDGIVTGIEIDRITYNLTAWPNPVSKYLNASFTLNNQTKFGLVITDNTGKEIEQLKERTLDPGEHTFRFDVSNKARGMLIIRFSFNGTIVTEKIIHN